MKRVDGEKCPYPWCSGTVFANDLAEDDVKGAGNNVGRWYLFCSECMCCGAAGETYEEALDKWQRLRVERKGRVA